MIGVAIDLKAEELPQPLSSKQGEPPASDREVAETHSAREMAARARVVIGKDGKVLKNSFGTGVTVGVTGEGDLHIVLAKGLVS